MADAPPSGDTGYSGTTPSGERRAWDRRKTISEGGLWLTHKQVTMLAGTVTAAAVLWSVVLNAAKVYELPAAVAQLGAKSDSARNEVSRVATQLIIMQHDVDEMRSLGPRVTALEAERASIEARLRMMEIQRGLR